ncbi:MAG: DUF4830 domain-containing protein [Ruminococcaceae bacterium]|nr:DUF4830 domain-containing protein [Oscillospiraceae bacterium]
MFVYSVKTSKAKIAALIIAIVAVIIAIAMIMTGEKEPAANDSAVNYKAENSSERAAFVSQFGWKISEDPAEISEVIIPEDFDAGYVEYAAMNKAQGLDLEPYKGVRAKRWTYDVLNYPGLENMRGTVQINILIYDGRVIGGDVCSLEQGGFIHGFTFPEPAVPQTTSEPMSAQIVTSAVQN